MRRLIQSVPQNVAQDLWVLLERAFVPNASDLPRRAVADRRLPPGFPAFAFAGLLCIAAAGVHRRLLGGEPLGSRQRTSLHARKIAYASWNRMGIP
jgi:hypothetical protein